MRGERSGEYSCCRWRSGWLALRATQQADRSLTKSDSAAAAVPVSPAAAAWAKRIRIGQQSPRAPVWEPGAEPLDQLLKHLRIDATEVVPLTNQRRDIGDRVGDLAVDAVATGPGTPRDFLDFLQSGARIIRPAARVKVADSFHQRGVFEVGRLEDQFIDHEAHGGGEVAFKQPLEPNDHPVASGDAVMSQPGQGAKRARSGFFMHRGVEHEALQTLHFFFATGKGGEEQVRPLAVERGAEEPSTIEFVGQEHDLHQARVSAGHPPLAEQIKAEVGEPPIAFVLEFSVGHEGEREIDRAAEMRDQFLSSFARRPESGGGKGAFLDVLENIENLLRREVAVPGGHRERSSGPA